MDTEQIACILNHCKIFRGVYPSDMLPKNVSRPGAIVANTHPSDKPGEHWVAIYLKPNRKGEYFDSYGLAPIEPRIEEFMNEMCPDGWKYNTVALQDANSFTCGYYSVLYIICKNFGV